MTKPVAVLILIAAAACAPEASSSAQVGDPGDPAPRVAPRREIDPAAIEGAWRIVSVNGSAVASIGEGSDRVVSLSFSATGYGGYSGCNAFGGLGLLEGDRYYGASASQTLVGCDARVTAQENAILGLMQSAPRVLPSEDGALTLTAGKRNMMLRRAPQLATEASRAVSNPPLLAGTRWRIDAIDGRRPQTPSRDERGTLNFEADTWTGRAACATRSGGWSQEGDRIVARGASPVTMQPCAGYDALFDEGLAALMRARPRFAVGRNGELLIAGGGHWIEGERARDLSSNDASGLLGAWRIAEIDGAPPAGGTRPTLSFGPAGYGGTTGCNAIRGLYVATGRRVFTAPGPQTEQGCGVLTRQEERITGLLASAPRLALAGGGRAALIDRAGRLLLVRDGPATAAPVVPQAREVKSLTGRAVDVALDGVPTRMKYGDPGSWFALSPGRWEARVGCTTMRGIWRFRKDAVQVYSDARPDPAAKCASVAQERDRTLLRMMNGRVRAVLGTNGELLIAGEDHWLTGRIDPPLTRKARTRG